MPLAAFRGNSGNSAFPDDEIGVFLKAADDSQRGELVDLSCWADGRGRNRLLVADRAAVIPNPPA